MRLWYSEERRKLNFKNCFECDLIEKENKK